MYFCVLIVRACLIARNYVGFSVLLFIFFCMLYKNVIFLINSFSKEKFGLGCSRWSFSWLGQKVKDRPARQQSASSTH